MIIEVNNAIGRDICTDADDVIVVSSYSFIITNGSVVTNFSQNAIHEHI